MHPQTLVLKIWSTFNSDKNICFQFVMDLVKMVARGTVQSFASPVRMASTWLRGSVARVSQSAFRSKGLLFFKSITLFYFKSNINDLRIWDPNFA